MIMANFGKRNVDFGGRKSVGDCLRIAMMSCDNAARSLCECSKRTANSTSYNSKRKTYLNIFAKTADV